MEALDTEVCRSLGEPRLAKMLERRRMKILYTQAAKRGDFGVLNAGR